jgi:hypothetical protein
MTAVPARELHPLPHGAREQPRQVDKHASLFHFLVVAAHRADEFFAGRRARLRIPLDHHHHPHVMSPSCPSRAGDDTTDREPQGDDEIGRPSLYDAEGEMGHPSALDHPGALQVDRPGAEVVEQ